MPRRSSLFALTAVAALGILLASPPSDPGRDVAWAKGEGDAYAKDVLFLLDECPKRARALLAAKK